MRRVSVRCARAGRSTTVCRTSDVIGTDDQVRSQNLDRREREGRALWVDRSYARPELHADVERHDSTVEVCAMEAVVACAVQLNHRFGVPAQVSYEFAVAVPPKHGGMGLHAESVQGECEGPSGGGAWSCWVRPGCLCQCASRGGWGRRQRRGR